MHFIIKDRRRGENKFSQSPNKVQFNEMTGDTQENKDADTRSDQTSPLVTESITDVNNSEIQIDDDEEDNVRKRLPDYFFREIQEQYGYDCKRLNRIKCRKEDELIEHNYGIDLSKIRDNPAEMAHLRKYLVKW